MDVVPAAAGRVRKIGTSAAAASGVTSTSRAVKFVDLLKEGVVSKEEYERLVEPVKERKRRAERVADRASQPPSVRNGGGAQMDTGGVG